ncbi:MAG: cellulase family glycosylhydrolase [Ruminococcus sp.]|nr:cellulase family glycosylhydrolase [Ruminococcus sp.]
MKIFKRIMAGVSAMAMMSICCYSAVDEVSNMDTAEAIVDDCNDDWLHAEGSRLYDMDGNEVWLTGANWFGLNCGENALHGLWSADIDELLSSIADHGINCLRMPISTELLLSWMNGTPNEVSSVSAGNDAPYYVINPDFLDESGNLKDSLGIFEVVVQKCKKYGIKIIMDIHSPAAHNSGHNYNLWYYDSDAGDADNMAVTADGVQVTTEMWQDTLVWLADKYSNDDTIIAYDLKNEPHGKGQEGSSAAKWDDSTDENNWAYAATQCALAIMEVNPNALILIEGVEQYTREGKTWGQPDSETDPPYYPAWWGGNLRGVAEYPIDLGEYQSQVVYSPHDYGPGVYAQTWFNKDFTTETLLDDYWYDTWAYINDQDIAPLLMGEWGGFMDDGDNEKWLTLLRDYMIDNHINHTFWCINPNSGDTGGLLDSSFENWDDDKYNLLEPALWQDEDGVYIGLDHQTALGSNGQSLSDYYASGKSSNLDSDGSTSPKDPIVTTATTTSEPEETSVSDTDESTTTTLDTDESTTTTPDTDTSTTTENTTDGTSETSFPDETTIDSNSSTSSSSDSDIPMQETLLGDVNCDGSVKSNDLLLLKKYLLGLDDLDEQALLNADLNGDNDVKSNDLLSLKKQLLGLE